jgi:hypothetical protein
MSIRAELTDEPHIENILEKYQGVDDLLVLALGSSYWIPPEIAITRMTQDIHKQAY